MITVVHHSADYDGLFCREIARKFLPDAELIGWDFGQPRIPFPDEGLVYVLDLPPECIESLPDINEVGRRLLWIDHHKSSIEKWTDLIPGYRIDGVAACRLAWQWFSIPRSSMSPAQAQQIWPRPTKKDFLERNVREPYSVMLAGEYDVWDHVSSGGADVTFQFGLDAATEINWDDLLGCGEMAALYTTDILNSGVAAQQCYKKRDADIVTTRGFDIDFEGLKFRALNTARCNSQTFEAAIRPEHDGCLAFYWNGKSWVVSMYGVEHKPGIDLSQIAVKHGGGGHKQACGFQAAKLPWLP